MNRQIIVLRLITLLSITLFLAPSSVIWAAVKNPEDFLKPEYFDQSIDPNWYLSVSYNKILTALKNSEYSKAIETAKELIGKRPTDARGHLLLTLSWLGNGDEEQLRQHLKELEGFNQNLAALIRLTAGRFYAREKRYYKSLAITRDLSNERIQSQTLQLRAKIYTLQGRTTDALFTYKELYRLDSTNHDTLLNLARLSMINRHLVYARQYADELLKLQPNNPPAALILGTVNLMDGDLPGAQSAFHSIAAKDPISQMGLGHASLIDKDFPSALKHYQNVLEQFPAMIEALQGLAITDIAMGNQKIAQEVLKQAKDTASQDPLTHLIEAASYATKGKTGSAGKSLKKTGALFFDINNPKPEIQNILIEEIKTSALNLGLSNYLYRQGYFQLTEKIIGEQGGDEQLMPLSLMTKARALSKDGKDKKALALYQILIDKHPNLLAPIMEQADIHFRLNDPKQAKKGYEQAVAINPYIPDLHLRLGNLYNHLNQSKLAIKQYNEALEIKRGPHIPIALGSIATTLLEKEQKPKEALKFAEKALKLAPNSKQLILLIGNIHLESKEYQKALELYTKLNITNDLKEPIDHYRFGILLNKAGRHKDAAQAFENALNFGKDFQGKEQAEQRYAELISN
ncbi:MAG: tetratricopeptide repeat protein [Pseudomonadota bacterium]